MNSLNAMSLREKRRGGGGVETEKLLVARGTGEPDGRQGAPNRTRLEGRGELESHTSTKNVNH